MFWNLISNPPFHCSHFDMGDSEVFVLQIAIYLNLIHFKLRTSLISIYYKYILYHYCNHILIGKNTILPWNSLPFTIVSKHKCIYNVAPNRDSNSSQYPLRPCLLCTSIMIYFHEIFLPLIVRSTNQLNCWFWVSYVFLFFS